MKERVKMCLLVLFCFYCLVAGNIRTCPKMHRFHILCIICFKHYEGPFMEVLTVTWMKVFRILRLTFQRKSSSKCCIKEIIIASVISFQRI